MELWTTPETHHNVGAVRAASSSAGLSEHSGDTCTPRTRRKIKKTEKTINGTGTGTASRSIAQHTHLHRTHTHLYRTQVQVCPGRKCRGVQVSSSAGPPPGQAQKNKKHTGNNYRYWELSARIPNARARQLPVGWGQRYTPLALNNECTPRPAGQRQREPRPGVQWRECHRPHKCHRFAVICVICAICG